MWTRPTRRCGRRGRTGEDLGQCLDQAALLLAAAAAQLEREQVHAPVEEAPVVGQLDVDLVAEGAPGPQLVDRHLVQPLEEVVVEDAVDAAPLLLLRAVGRRVVSHRPSPGSGTG